MSTEERTGARGTIATVVATAAVTLAIGVTAAALGGYLVPDRSTGALKAEQAATPATVETAPASQPAVAGVVLVPVAPDSPREPLVAARSQPDPEVFSDAYAPSERGGGGDHHRRRDHREDEDDDEDDHDDDD